jgi:hypothetical protein
VTQTTTPPANPGRFTEPPRRFQDRQFVLGRRLHRRVGRLIALEDAVDVTRRAPANTPSISRKHLPAAVRVSIGCPLIGVETPVTTDDRIRRWCPICHLSGSFFCMHNPSFARRYARCGPRPREEAHEAARVHHPSRRRDRPPVANLRLHGAAEVLDPGCSPDFRFGAATGFRRRIH